MDGLMAKRPSAPQREWGNESLLTLDELSRKPLPIKRSYDTWLKWVQNGVAINGAVHHVPHIEIAGVVHTSVEAVIEFLNSIDTGSLRERRGA
jgi:hypothetical protein